MGLSTYQKVKLVCECLLLLVDLAAVGVFIYFVLSGAGIAGAFSCCLTPTQSEAITDILPSLGPQDVDVTLNGLKLCDLD